MSAADPRTYLWAKIKALMGGGEPSLDAVAERARVPRSLVQRVKDGKASVRIGSLIELAEGFGLEVWELLTPPPDGVAPRPAVRRPPALFDSLESIATAASRCDPLVRADAADLVALVVKNPDQNASDQIPVIVRKLSGGVQAGRSQRNLRLAALTEAPTPPYPARQPKLTIVTRDFSLSGWMGAG